MDIIDLSMLIFLWIIMILTLALGVFGLICLILYVRKELRSDAKKKVDSTSDSAQNECWDDLEIR